MKRFIITMIVTAFLFIGCSEDSTTEPGADSNFIFSFNGLDEEILAPAGAIREGSFSLTLRNTDGSIAPGVDVNLSVAGAIGTVIPDVPTSDANGNIEATYRITIPEDDGAARLMVRADNSTAYGIIHLKSSRAPHMINLSVDADERMVAHGENAMINVIASVVDVDGQGIPNAKIDFGLRPLGELATHFGSIVGDNFTDSTGHAKAVFNSEGGFGELLIKCNIAELGFENPISSVIPIRVFSLDAVVHRFSISVTPDIIDLMAAPEVRGVISVTAQDESNQGVAGLKIELEMEYGSFAQPAITNDLGQSSSDFIISRDVLPNLHDPLDLVVRASIPGTGWYREKTIRVLQDRYDAPFLEISSNRRYIWADGPGLSQAKIYLLLKDSSGQSLANEEILLSTSFERCTIGSPVVTDSMGRAQTIFDDHRTPSIDSVSIVAHHIPSGASAATAIMIREQNPVSEIRLFANARQLIANSGDSSAVRATCFLSDGTPASEGTRIIFDTDNGSFTEAVAFVEGNSGQALTFYLAGVIVGTAHLTATYEDYRDSTVSNVIEIDLIAGSPSYVSVMPYPHELITSDPTSTSTITATVTDTSGNPVRQGTYVTFEATLGTITPSAITDERGDATALLRPGVEAGISRIIATCQGRSGIAHVTFVAGRPNSVTLEADPLSIDAVTGLSTLRATIRDPNGNLVQYPTSVGFELVDEPDPPEGCSIGRGDNPIFYSRTSRGVATAVLHAGSIIGGKLVRAFTWRDSANNPEDIVDVILSTLSVVSGPPASISISMDDRGDRIGGGIWAVDVSARVWALNRNPVGDGVRVAFSVEPEVASIENSVTIGGVAQTQLLYDSEDTFEEIEITALIRAQDEDIVGGRATILPLQDGNLELNVDPANWTFEDGREEAEIRCWAVLTDGYGTEINNAPVLFSTARGRFGWKDVNDQRRMFYPNPARRFTGLHDQQNNEEPGQATVFLVAEEQDVFLDPFTLEVMVEVGARVEGYDDVATRPEFISFTRHAW